MEKFRFDLGIPVWFYYLGNAYEGRIIKQIYSRKLNPADGLNSEKDFITTSFDYYVECSAGQVRFTDSEFHSKVFIDKKLFLETVVIHK